MTRRRRSSLLFDLFAVNQQVRTLIGTAMADSPLPPDEYAVYSGVFEFAPITPTALARVVGMPPTTLSHYLRAMRERDHVVESPNPKDGRSRVLTLSDSGLVVHRTANRHFQGAYDAFFAHIDDEQMVKSALEAIESAAREARLEMRSKAAAKRN